MKLSAVTPPTVDSNVQYTTLDHNQNMAKQLALDPADTAGWLDYLSYISLMHVSNFKLVQQHSGQDDRFYFRKCNLM